MFKKMGLGLVTVAAVTFMGFGAQASDGGIYKYRDNNPTGGGIGNQMDFFEMTFQEKGGKDLFTLKYDLEIAKGPNGFWLVVSDGPNPKNHLNEYAILYGDLRDKRVTAYVYSGKNNGDSFKKAGNFIGSFENVISVDDDFTSISLEMDVSSINAYVPNNGMVNEWDGLAFGKKVGIWFHPADFSNTYYNHDGSINVHSKVRGKGWYDKDNLHATHISEPASLALLGLGLTGLGISRRRKAAA
jgi:hypothetical protein